MLDDLDQINSSVAGRINELFGQQYEDNEEAKFDI